MVYNKNKKGQAAIEFLMTYGWMLLVVLIVGALIFSFVDFGALLPNKVDITGSNFVPLVADSFAVNAAGGATGDVIIAFRYVGTNPVKIDAADAGHNIEYNLAGTNCNTNIIVYNKDTASYDVAGTGALADVPATPVPSLSSEVQFRNGHTGFIKFKGCTNFNQIDNIEGELIIKTISTTTGVSTPNYGTIRLSK